MKKLFSIIIVIIFALLLVYMTLLVRNINSYEVPNFSGTFSWNTSFEISESREIVYSSDSLLLVNYLWNSDKILSNGWKYSIEKNKISFEKWVYLVNINSLENDYVFSGEWFSIQTSWPTSFFVDNTESRVKIFSIDNILKVNFLNVKNAEETYNSSYLYPNQYVFFDPTKNFLIKSADLLRITQLLSLDYFNWKILENWKVNSNFKKLFFSKDEKVAIQTEKLFLFIYFDDLKNKKIIEEFKNKKFLSLTWEKIIFEYDFLLINNEKRAIYLKNKILRQIQEILNKNSLTAVENGDYSDFFDKKLEELKAINESDFEEISEFVKYFSSSLNSVEKWNISLLSFFTKLTNKTANIFDNKLLLALNSAYYKQNFSENKNFYSEVKEFIKSKNSWKIDEKEKNYFIFYLNKLILANLSEAIINFENTINILDIYTKASISYYSTSLDDAILQNKLIETWIVNFDKLFTIILEKIENEYFIRNTSWLLEAKSWKSMDKNTINLLASNIDKIYNFYTENNSKITASNSLVRENYKINLKKSQELLLALRDYQSYLVNFDTKINNLWAETQIDSSGQISVENAKKYLSRFNWLQFSSENIELMWKNFCNNPNLVQYKKEKSNPTCYQISEILAWNSTKLSFLLYPNDWNKITKISINWSSEVNKWVYKMDDLELEYEKAEQSSSVEASKYKFEDFFINVILANWTTTKKVEIYNDVNLSENESSIVRTIKNTTFLWKNGTLTKLNSILEVEYNDLKVTETDNWSDFVISISDATIKYSLEDEKYTWTFNSSYKYKAGQINSFLNPEITISIDWENDLLLGNKIKISWFVKLDDFENVMKNIFSKIKDISKVVLIINQKDYSWSISISYNATTDKFTISSKNIKLTTSWDKIDSIISFWKKIIDKQENLDKIEELLK